MKTIIVPTDFSRAANYAAIYALHIAKSLQADITLCHCFIVPGKTPGLVQEAWPFFDYQSVKNDTVKSLRILCKKMTLTERSISLEQDYHPLIDFKSHNCELKHMIGSLIKRQSSDFVVMGVDGGGSAGRPFMGADSRALVADAQCPILLVPGGMSYRPIKKIAFLTDFGSQAIETIQSLSSFASHFDAEILLINISGKTADNNAEKNAASFQTEVAAMTDYPKIYFNDDHFDSDDGLAELIANAEVDLLAMVYSKHNLFQQLLTATHPQKICGQSNMPLFVFPDDSYEIN